VVGACLQLGELVWGELVDGNRTAAGQVHSPAVLVDPEPAGGPPGVQHEQTGVRVEHRALDRARLDQHVHGGLIAQLGSRPG